MCHERHHKGFPTFYANSLEAWKKWLSEHHATNESVWLIIYKKDSGLPSVTYLEAVEEALCYGWIDSKPNKRDEQSYYQFFSRRNPRSKWSRINKERVERLILEGSMAEAGLKMVEMAKQNGTWDALNEVENLTLPSDLQAAFEVHPEAFDHWHRFPDSVKRGILEWIFNAKRKETRQKRIKETVTLAGKNIRANQYRQ